MSICFRSYRSSSAGNCLALWTADSCLLIDCGISTLRDCRALLRGHQHAHGPVSAVLVTHSHRDHVSRKALRVFEEEGIQVRSHRQVVSQLRERDREGGTGPALVRPLPDAEFAVGDFRIAAFPLSHQPDVPTFGFLVCAGHGTRQRTVAICTDFYDPTEAVARLAGADFVFVEANHDIELLAQHFNFNSRFHLNNRKTAWLLAESIRRSGSAPRHVVLGHLSEQRNRDRLALQEVEHGFARGRMRISFGLETAPKHEPSRIITLA